MGEDGRRLAGADPEPLPELAERQRRGALLVRPSERVLEPLQAVGGPLGAVKQPLDPAEIEPLALKILDQPQLRDVIGAVVADAQPHLGRRQQPPRLVRTDVADGHPRLGSELLDR